MKVVISFLRPVFGYRGSFETTLPWIADCVLSGRFPRHLIANRPGETYNTRALYRFCRDGNETSDFYPYLDPTREDYALRPISVFVDGRQISFDDLMEMAHAAPKNTYHRPLVWEGDPAFRNGPIAYTGKYRNQKYFVRSTGGRNKYEEKLRSDFRDCSWKTQCKCRKPWMKHKKNASTESIRNCCKRVVFEEDEALQD